MSRTDGANDGLKKTNPNPGAPLKGAMRLMMDKKKFEGSTKRELVTWDGEHSKSHGNRGGEVDE